MPCLYKDTMDQINTDCFKKRILNTDTILRDINKVSVFKWFLILATFSELQPVFLQHIPGT